VLPPANVLKAIDLGGPDSVIDAGTIEIPH